MNIKNVVILPGMLGSQCRCWLEGDQKSLRKDHRWGMADALSKSDKEVLFKEHIESLNQRKKEQFRKLLDDTPEVQFILQ